MKIITKAPILFRGGDYNPDQWLDRPDILEKDVEMMKKAGMNTATLGVFAWAKYEPHEGEYDFTWLRETMERHDRPSGYAAQRLSVQPVLPRKSARHH